MNHSLGIDASNIRGGGGLVHLRELLNAADPLASGISRVTVWGSPETIRDLPSRPWLEPVVEPDLSGNLPRRFFWQQTKLVRLATRLGCSAILVPGGRYTGRFKPFVAICQNLLPFCPRERARFGLSWTRIRYHLLEAAQKRTFAAAAGVIFLTHSAWRTVMRRMLGKRVRNTVIPHGVASQFRAEPRPQKALCNYSVNRPFRWLYVSIINEYKHQDKVSEAVALLRKQGIPLELSFVGPAYLKTLRKLKALLMKLDPDSRFLLYAGSVSHDQLPDLYRAADGFVFASSCENLPIIMLEAMASGLPIACSKSSPMPEILGDAGCYFEPENPAEIAEAMKRLMADRLYRGRCCELAGIRSRSYSWPRCARETLEFIAEVAFQA